MHCLRSRGGILFNPDWLLNCDGLGLVLLKMFFLGGGGCCVSGRGCCVSGVGDAASVRGVQHQRKGGCCVSEEGYYKIIWFYFLNC